MKLKGHVLVLDKLLKDPESTIVVPRGTYGVSDYTIRLIPNRTPVKPQIFKNCVPYLQLTTPHKHTRKKLSVYQSLMWRSYQLKPSVRISLGAIQIYL